MGVELSSDAKAQRYGGTTVTSVSVSREFQKLIAQHQLSPTETFRRGIAVTLYDLGVGMYQSQKNEERSKFMHEFLKRISEDEKMEKEYAQMKKFEKIRGHLNAINKITEEIENVS